VNARTPEEAKRRRHRNERIFAAAVVLLIGVGAWRVVRHGQEIEADLRSVQSYMPKAVPVTPEVELLQQYIRFDTTNPPGNEIAAARWLASLLTKGGVQAEIIESAPGRANVYARIKGKRPGEGLLLLHHMDVVAADGKGWTRPPFAGEIHLNQLFGRGALDVKGPGICFLRAFLDVAAAGRAPQRDVVFLAVADEETGSALGMRWLLDKRPDVVEGVRYALNEGGITEMQQEKITYYGVEIGTKLSTSALLRAPTREALQRTRIALEPYFVSREPQRVMPEVKRFFTEIAPQRIEFRGQLENVDRTIAMGQFWRLPVGYRELTQNGVWVDLIRPAADGRGFTMRAQLLNLPDEDPDERLRWLAATIRPFGVRVAEVLRKEGPVPLSRVDTPLYRLLATEAAATWKAPVGTEIINRWFNDSRFLRARGIEAYGINPFPVDFFQAEAIHARDERVRIDYFVAGVEFTRRLVRKFTFEN
jgi:acetylornithine deacetylase/succinyl-diaminopimelate desuccinylase-like protein